MAKDEKTTETTASLTVLVKQYEEMLNDAKARLTAALKADRETAKAQAAVLKAAREALVKHRAPKG